MENRTPGCLSASGILSGFVTLLAAGAFYVVLGGRLFSPGALSAQAGQEPKGGVRSHAETGADCAACHTNPWGQETMSERCLDCHTEVSQELGDPTSLHSILQGYSDPFLCQACHKEHRGASAELTFVDQAGFPHAETGYALTGHTRRTDGGRFNCRDCHLQNFTAFDQGQCTACHQELDSAFMLEHRTTFGPGCLECHDGFDTYGARFDHDQLAFPLQGAHARTPCDACHEGATTIAMLQAAPQDCFACHAEDDFHAGQLGESCELCHTPARWEDTTFDHALTGFSLEGRHAEAACEDCHLKNVYRGTPQDCFACHAQDDAHEGRFGQDCVGCHSPDGWEGAAFDHSLADFALTGAHVEVACEDCHGDGVFAGTPQDCFACHAQDDAHEGRFGQDCAGCHTTDRWEGATFDHSMADFPLTGAHLQVECTQCHVGEVFAGTPQDCVACHQEPAYHLGLFDRDCQACHTADAWQPALYNGPHTFPMRHGDPAGCATCHPDALQTYTCYDCHEHDPDRIARKHREEGISDFQNCIECHPTGREEEGEDD